MELQAELTGRDGLKRAWRVQCEPPGELRGLLAGLSRLREEVAARLDPLVQKESVAASGDRDERGDDDEDGDEEEEEEEEGKHINTKAYSDEPPLKRTKSHS
ncbi:EKC/KEOPS complex subunit GON7 isoform X2 [Pseudonaja textilis]|uniref:EKC/KEOPS complex subunit GON7 isoform X2 n=1 Tax=Pseudonaja textilis TaxID=8673 RepID=UPI000EAA01C7|nr:EKC/KEOPS complex subunit GON7 isoform X2 [Pseudonaja textilis]